MYLRFRLGVLGFEVSQGDIQRLVPKALPSEGWRPCTMG